MPAPVLVATDFSPSARVAIAHAARIAERRGAPLHALTVVDSEQVLALAAAVNEEASRVESRVVDRARALLGREVADAGVSADPAMHAVVGRPGRAIEAACESLSAGLLVLGYQGRSERGRGPGSVASRCVRHAPCDVLLTRRNHPGPYVRVVVGVDLGEHSGVLGARGVEMAERDGRVFLLHAHTNPFESLAFAGFGMEQADRYQEHAAGLARRLEGLAEGVRAGAHATVTAELVVDPNHGRAIAAWSNAHGADLAVVGAVSKPGLRYWLLGSTAETVLRETDSAVLAVRGHG